MTSKFVKLALAATVSLVAAQSFASNIMPVGVYQIGGPTTEIGEKNILTVFANGNVVLDQQSGRRYHICRGQSQLKNEILKISGLCDEKRDFEMIIDLSEVTPSQYGYFRAPVLSSAIYPKPVQMEFLLIGEDHPNYPYNNY